jgi:hypothetical protein
MLINLLNPLLESHNGTEVVPLRWVPLIELPVGDKVLTYLIVEAWCVRRPAGELTGNYTNCLSAFAAAWRIKP